MQVMALIGDVVASRAVPQRAVLQRQLQAALTAAGRRAQGVASPYTLTLGDEFQAVYRRAATVFADIVGIMADVHPVQVRFALGVGPLATRLNPRQALGMDGPAFHHARAALQALKADGRLLRIASGAGADWALANRTLNLCSHQMEGWTRNRLAILAGLLRERRPDAIGAELGISTVAVYKNINAAALHDMVGVCRELAGALDAAMHGA